MDNQALGNAWGGNGGPIAKPTTVPIQNSKNPGMNICLDLFHFLTLLLIVLWYCWGAWGDSGVFAAADRTRERPAGMHKQASKSVWLYLRRPCQQPT
eukprot:3083879-Amphidinium_carterae.1